ncbi:dienelactone hydrolase family protein [Halalkalibacter krulwichiae]|uniref:Abhydrolase family protein n=1 Tax=Halalkalibacter krulwichiae TaxID=199441 RepID=A0A1X9MA65_9BACI|nr:alpha/beta hydrolase family protein [Halalkalibacter krulwichiae]ARK29544.1 Abhydrolase family protein [Halalkalibacter krulwichiae]
MWSPDLFLKQLYGDLLKKHNNYDAHWKTRLKGHLQNSLGDFSHLRAELNPITLGKVEYEDYFRLRVEITTSHSLKMPIYVLIPKMRKIVKRPAVLALHGHGYGSKEVVGLHPGGLENKGNPGIHKNVAVELVKKGMVVIAPELVGFGDRKLTRDKTKELATDNSCFELSSQLLLMGKTLAGLRVFECRRVLDYMETMEEIDSAHIGCIGLSGGGLVAGFTSALDLRIRATVISGYTNTFKGSIMARRHCLDNYLPGILIHAELPELLGLISPRPLFVEAGIWDHLFPYTEVKNALRTIDSIYKSDDASSHLSAHFFEGGHEICGERSYDWLIQQLNIET